jgi:hypothetical protein
VALDPPRSAPRDAPGEPVPEQHRLSRREQRQLHRLRARKVRRIVRRIDPWTVLKFSLLFYLCLFLITLVAAVVLWTIAAAAGTLHGVEDFVKDLGDFKTFTFNGAQLLAAFSLAGLVLVIVGTAANVLLAVLFNLIGDLTGGIRVTVIEEESTRRTVV